VDPEDAHVGGKFYSANVNTLATMDARGMRVAMSPAWPDDLDADAEVAVKAMAREELARMFHGLSPKEIAQRKFLLLDDGGKLIKALHEFYPQYAKSCVCVEQTTRGIQVLDEMKAAGTPVLCPVVNMAQCELKRVVESPLIAESIAWHTDKYVRALGLADRLPAPGREPQPTAVVVGFGATGAALAEALRRRGYAVVVTDTDADKLRAARDAGFAAADKADALGRADFLFGATGRGSLSEKEWALVKSGAILANGASGTHELGLVDGSPGAKDREKRTDAHGTITTTFGGRAMTLGSDVDDDRLRHRVVRARDAAGAERELLLLRGGAVVNMEHDLPPEYRQIIVAMLLASCFQALRETEPGPHDLDLQVQQFLRARFEKALAAEGLSLTHPDLDAVRGPWG
jgi:hypothetical protein